MSPDANKPCTLAVDVAQQAVDAGGRLSLTVRATGLGADLIRPLVILRDGDGVERTRAGLARDDTGGHTSGEIIVAAPRAVGHYLWRAVVVASGSAGASCEHATADVRFAVVPHTLDFTMWGMPRLLIAGRSIRLQAGIKCSGGCAMGGQTLSIRDAQDRLVAQTEFTDERWPETEAIYAAEIELRAPAVVGEYNWAITAAAPTLDLPHAPATQQMSVTVVAAPDCVVTIVVRDRETEAPLDAARVTLGPYAATTAADGLATIPVAKGPYDLQVARKGYKPFAKPITVRSEVYATAALEAEPQTDGADKG